MAKMNTDTTSRRRELSEAELDAATGGESVVQVAVAAGEAAHAAELAAAFSNAVRAFFR
jgi:hypothetical protein